MIEAKATGQSSLIARLANTAERLALAHAEIRQRALRQDATRWRSAKLLWPLFSRDI